MLIMLVAITACVMLFAHSSPVSKQAFSNGKEMFSAASYDAALSTGLASDDDLIYAEDNDGDDLSESMMRLLPVAITTLTILLFIFSFEQYLEPALRYAGRSNSHSFLKVFRI